MSRGDARGLAHSIQQRLLNHAHAAGEEFNLTLRRYLFERFLYRLGRSAARERFVLKGAMLLGVWSDRPYRATMDLDLLRLGPADLEGIAADLRTVCETPVQADAVMFEPGSLSLERIREEDEYAGLRARLPARLGSARERLQIDIGTGDAVWPEPGSADYPRLLDLPPPHILVYPREAVIAEKLEAMVVLGLPSSRIKDLFDIHHLAVSFDFEGIELAESIARTFARRKTPLPDGLPLMLTDEYWLAPGREAHLRAFARRARLDVSLASAAALSEQLRSFLRAPLESLARGVRFEGRWKAGGPWRLAGSRRHEG